MFTSAVFQVISDARARDFVRIDCRVKAQTSLHRTARGIVLDPIAGEHRQFSVVPLDGNCDMVFPFRREKEALDPRAKFHRPRRLENVVVGLFERAHPCPRCDRLILDDDFSTRKLRSCRPSHKTTKRLRRCGSWYHERMKFWIGTSGFQHSEWRGEFYPEKLPASKMLPFYAERFPTTEINYTFRRTPSGKTIESCAG